MPRLMRKRLFCFYCGGRSTREYLPTIRQWKCEICDAENHLDEQGEITDPPPVESLLLPQARFAQPIPRPASPEFAPPDGSLFCKTCLQNQKFLTDTLASYFPPPTAPEYAEYERNYPEYRKNLEDRYPQVCRNCEPRVRRRIRITGYAAKTDHLRRMMERSKGSSDRGGYRRWTWKRLALSIGSVAWHTSIAGQILWNLGGALTTVEGDEREDDGLSGDASSFIPTCLARSWSSGRTSFVCSRQLDAMAGLALGLGLLSVWWNPRFQERLDRGSGRLLGLTEYYKLQIIFLVLRVGSYVALTRSPIYDFDAQTMRAMHTFMTIFTLISVVISFRSTQLDLAPRVWPASLISQSEGIPEEENYYDQSQGQEQSDRLRTRPPFQPQAFSLNDLAPDRSRSRPPPYNPPTPPPDEDDFEEMDWTPSQQPLPPASNYRMPAPKIAVQPSPFYGRLPPAPLSQAHKLRNPPNQPTFRQASVAQKQSFFNRGRSHLEADDISEASSECFDSPTKSIIRSEVASPRFAEPRFFPPSDYERNTGLESIFSKTFSIAEEPHELRVARELKQQSANRHAHNSLSLKLQALSIPTLAFSLLAWIFASSISPRLAVYIRLACLGVATLVAGRGLLATVQRGKVYYWRWSDLFVYGVELVLSAVLGKATKVHPPRNGSTDEVGMLGIAFLGVMFVQELWVLLWASKLDESSTTASVPGNPKPAPSAPPPAIIMHSSSPPKKKEKRPKSSAPPPVVVASSGRTTRSQSRRESSSIAATSRLGGLSLNNNNNSGGDEAAQWGL